MRKNIFHSQLTALEKQEAFPMMHNELHGLDFKHPIRTLFLLAWEDFENNKFSFDGPTFVKSRFKSRWELASFIHDWRNAKGHVGKEIDNEFFSVMITLNYNIHLIIERWLFCRLTWINILRHKVKGTYNNNQPPKLLFSL